MKVVFSLAILLLPLTTAVADDAKSLDSFVAEFNADALKAKEKYLFKKVTLEIEIKKADPDEAKHNYFAVLTNPPKNSQVVFHLVKSYRPGDTLVIAGTLKQSTWDKDEKRLFFDGCEVVQEVQVQPPMYTSTALLDKYLKNPKKVSEEFVGKPVDIKGVVRFVKLNSAILEYVPDTDSRGRVRHDVHGFEFLGRALLTVKFSDDTIRKVDLKKGMTIEARGVVESMQAGAIVVKDAQLLNK
jgi:hypothetical protein